jgi:hypothetical protein
MLKFYNHQTNIRFILENADTNFLPLKNYKIIKSPSKILDYPHLRMWADNEYWEEVEKLYDPSKICYVINKEKNYNGFYDKVLKNKCSLLENYTVENYRYIIFSTPRKFNCPQYDFKSQGSILLHYGGGYGDFINCLRYIKLHPNCDFVVEIKESMKRLVCESNLFKKIIIKGDECKTDFHLPINALFERHGPNGSGIPFLNIRKNEQVNGGIGFCFQGNRVKYSPRRTFDPYLLEEFSDYNLYNIQKEVRDISFAKNLPIHDWLDTAQIIQGCDLVICPPTAITHLAGSLGKKLFVVFQDCYSGFEKIYFNKNSSDYYPLIEKIHSKNLIDCVREYVKNKYG